MSVPSSGGGISPSKMTSALAGIGRSVATPPVISTGPPRIQPAKPYSETPQLKLVPAATSNEGSWPSEIAIGQDFPLAQYFFRITSPWWPEPISPTILFLPNNLNV